MAKPAELADWANDANYPAGAEPEAGFPTKVAPTTGQENVGWRPDQIPAAEEDNDWRHRVGLWVAYMNSGVFDGDHKVEGDLEVEGDVYHGDREMQWGFGAINVSTGAVSFNSAFATTSFCWSLTASGVCWRVLDGMKKGDRLKEVSVYANTSDTDGTLTLYKYNYDDGAIISATVQPNGWGVGEREHLIVDDPDDALLGPGDVFMLKIIAPDTDALDMTQIRVVYDRPKPP
jgi:hypothetical protein